MKMARQMQTVLHYPRLDTVLMVEEAVKNAEEYPTRTELWRALPRKVQYQTFKLILEYLLESNKVYVTKEGRIMWVFAASKKAGKLLHDSKKYDRKFGYHT